MRLTDTIATHIFAATRDAASPSEQPRLLVLSPTARRQFLLEQDLRSTGSMFGDGGETFCEVPVAVGQEDAAPWRLLNDAEARAYAAGKERAVVDRANPG